MLHLNLIKSGISVKVLLLLVFLHVTGKPEAAEGMWLPMLFEKQLINDMQAEGLQLTAEEIYSVNKACLKDAVIKFSSGCTASFISPHGLMLTNHHCSDDYIQHVSTLDKNYLKDGFWSSHQKHDLPIEGLSVKVLEYMKDVTDEILRGVDAHMTERKRSSTIRFNTNKLIRQLSKNRTFHVQIKELYHGNQFIALVSKEFNDVRLVGAPPISVADYGGDTDNWEWPRHGADFALFRVYANHNNQPASYHSHNIPYTPKKSLTLQAKGIQKGDFTFVLGYPGTTDLYATSFKIKMLKDDLYPARIGARDQKLNVMKRGINRSEELQLKYNAKASTVSNSWKKWQGEISGLNRLQVVEKKIEYEQEITSWANQTFQEENPAENLFTDYRESYAELSTYYIPNRLIVELTGKNGMETVCFSEEFPSRINRNDSLSKIDLNNFLLKMRTHFDDFDFQADKEIAFNLLAYYLPKVPEKYVPTDLRSIEPYDSVTLKKYVNKLYKKSFFADSTKLKKLMQRNEHQIESKLEKDPARRLKNQFNAIQSTMLTPSIKLINSKLDSLNRKYMQLILQSNKISIPPPDANSSFRVSHGKVEGYSPKDGVAYDYFTTVDGILEKGRTDNPDYQINERLKELYAQKNFGAYAWNGTLPICFIASNHTTGGNSGSPVLNKNGEMIGINFDRAWEGVYSDFYYSPQLSRNISVDIRYVLFIIDKFAGAKYLLDEMNIVK